MASRGAQKGEFLRANSFRADETGWLSERPSSFGQFEQEVGAQRETLILFTFAITDQ